MPTRIQQSVALRVPLQAFLAADHVTPATGLTIAVTISKNGGAYGNPSGGATNATEIANGSYYVDLSATDTGTVGPLFVRGAVSTMDPRTPRRRIHFVLRPAAAPLPIRAELGY